MEDHGVLLGWRVATWVTGPLDFQAEVLKVLEQALGRMKSHPGSIKASATDVPSFVLPTDVAPSNGFQGFSRLVTCADSRWSREALGTILQKCQEALSSWPEDGMVLAASWCKTLPTHASDTNALALHRDFQQGGMEVSTVEGFRKEVRRAIYRLVPGWEPKEIMRVFSSPQEAERVDEIAMRILQEKTLRWAEQHPLSRLWKQEMLNQALPSVTSSTSYKPRF